LQHERPSAGRPTFSIIVHATAVVSACGRCAPRIMLIVSESFTSAEITADW
jgi:hypothetical protein